jgi:hypothetical protein
MQYKEYVITPLGAMYLALCKNGIEVPDYFSGELGTQIMEDFHKFLYNEFTKEEYQEMATMN